MIDPGAFDRSDRGTYDTNVQRAAHRRRRATHDMHTTKRTCLTSSRPGRPMKDGPTANWLPAGRGDDSRPHQARRARRRWQGQRWRGRRVRRRKRLRRQRRGGISVFGGDGSGLASDRCCGRACPGAGCTSAIDSPCDATRETMPERIRKARVENRLRVTEVKKITKSAIEEQGRSLRCGRGEPGAATCFRALPHREQVAGGSIRDWLAANACPWLSASACRCG